MKSNKPKPKPKLKAKAKKTKASKWKVYYRDYYKTHRAEILSKAKEDYYKNKKKVGKCKMCGKELPKELPGNTKYCEKCLYSKGHGPDAHRMAAVRWFRKNGLTTRKGISTI